MIRVINNQFELQGVIDVYRSFIPDRSFYGVGNFELHLDYTKENREMLKEENILFMDIEKPYVILYVELVSEDNSMIVKGKELKQYISRWITEPLAGQAYHRIGANAEHIMKRYVGRNCEIPNLITGPDLARGKNMVFQTRYKQLDEELEKIGLVSELGWTVKLDTENKKFVFDVIEGRDRTAGQGVNPRAIFDVEFDNIGQQRYFKSKLQYKNVAIVAGQGEGTYRTIRVVGDATGFDRYETFVDARDIENDADLPERGLQKLAELEVVEAFESEALTDANLEYEKDYDLGDLVTVQSREWGVTLDTRIVAISEIYEEKTRQIDLVFGNNLPNYMEVIKRQIDMPTT